MRVDGIVRWKAAGYQGTPDYSPLWPDLAQVAPVHMWTVEVDDNVGLVLFHAVIGQHRVEVAHSGLGPYVTLCPADVPADAMATMLHPPRELEGFGDANGCTGESVVSTYRRAFARAALTERYPAPIIDRGGLHPHETAETSPLPMLLVCVVLVALALLGCGDDELPCALMRCAPGGRCVEGVGCLTPRPGIDGERHLYRLGARASECGVLLDPGAEPPPDRCRRCWKH